MNIFALSYDVFDVASYHVDSHVVKMPLETAQMLCTNLVKLGIDSPYLPVHQKHPCTLWAGLTKENYSWLCDLGLALCMEFTYRYKKVHSCENVINYCLTKKNYLPSGGMTEFAQAMPDEYKDKDSIVAYRRYYIYGKKHLHKWSKRDIPYWLSHERIAI